ncbi:MAG: hypothetical protein BWY77_01483 [bacterium ADurb.Bin431]|nr:MAG: hypothetical protein BWY77_01483 [bacterium ADurb.Bin431]
MILALLGLDVDDPGHGLTVLGVESAGDDLEILDRRGVDIEGVGIAREGILDRLAVDDVEALVGAPAADVNLVVLDHYAELLADQVGDALDYLLADLLGGDMLLGGGDIGLKEGFLTDDLNGLAQGQHSGLERKIGLGGLIRLNMDAGAHLDGIADDGGLEIVIPGSEAADFVEPLHIGHRPLVGAGHGDIDTRQGFVGALVRHAPPDEGGLSQCAGGAKAQQESEGDYPAGCLHGSVS